MLNMLPPFTVEHLVVFSAIFCAALFAFTMAFWRARPPAAKPSNFADWMHQLTAEERQLMKPLAGQFLASYRKPKPASTSLGPKLLPSGAAHTLR